jgi:signal transduction histidine kinase
MIPWPVGLDRMLQPCIRRLLLLACLLWGPLAQADLLTLNQAQARILVDGQTTEVDVALPYNWDIHNRAQHGEAVFQMRFELEEQPVDPWGAYLPSVGNAYDVRLNGTLLQRQGDLVHGNGADYSKVPRFIVISPNLLQQSNVLQVHLRVDAARRGGLSEVVIGPQEEAFAAYQHSYRWRGNGSLVVLAFSLLVGLLALGLWLTQVDIFHPSGARRDPLYLFAALAELSWTLAVGDALLESPPVPWPWWGAVPAAGAAAWACNMQLFCIEVAGWQSRPLVPAFRRWLLYLVALSVVLPLWAAGAEQPLALSAWHATLALTFLGFGAVFLRRAVDTSNRDHRVVAAALLLNLLVGIWDLWNFRISPTFPDNSLLRFSSLFFGLSLGVIVISRFRTASHKANSLLTTFSARMSEKEADLRESYHLLETQAREQERIAERSRILRDMHDGVGSHISMAIRQLQSDAVSPASTEHAEVLHTLRDALDQLKLSIDAINLLPGDITSLLANLRYRLGPRLSASGIELVWDVDLLHVESGLDASATRHLQFMLYEALSNVVQHARAGVLRIEAHAEFPGGLGASQVVRVRVVDDGCGFDVQTQRRKGLSSMHERAVAIGARLHISSQPGRTQVEIQFG